jgi:hypothetical protein
VSIVGDSFVLKCYVGLVAYYVLINGILKGYSRQLGARGSGWLPVTLQEINHSTACLLQHLDQD